MLVLFNPGPAEEESDEDLCQKMFSHTTFVCLCFYRLRPKQYQYPDVHGPAIVSTIAYRISTAHERSTIASDTACP